MITYVPVSDPYMADELRKAGPRGLAMFKRITTEQAQELHGSEIVYYDAPPLAVQLVDGLYYKRYVDAEWPKVLTWDAFRFPEYSYYLLLEE